MVLIIVFQLITVRLKLIDLCTTIFFNLKQYIDSCEGLFLKDINKNR